jgi:hypothetical protein
MTDSILADAKLRSSTKEPDTEELVKLAEKGERWLLQANELHDNAQSSAAFALFTQVLDLKPCTDLAARAHMGRAGCLLELNDLDSCVAACDAALACRSRNEVVVATAYYYQALVCTRTHDLRGALAKCAASLVVNPRQANVLRVTGHNLIKLGARDCASS